MNLFTNVRSLMIGDKSVLSLKYNDGILWERGNLIPDDYIQLAYLETDGSQFVNSMINASHYPNGLYYEMRAHVLGYLASNTNNYFFGALANNSRSGNLCVYPNSTDSAFRLYVAGSSSPMKVCADYPLNTDFTITASINPLDPKLGTLVYYNETRFSNAGTAAVIVDMPDAEIYLFTANGVAETNGKFYGRLYSFQMKERINMTPLRNFIPCRRKSDGTLGLYDTVSELFFVNSGSGEFIAGPEILK